MKKNKTIARRLAGQNVDAYAWVQWADTPLDLQPELVRVYFDQHLVVAMVARGPDYQLAFSRVAFQGIKRIMTPRSRVTSAKRRRKVVRRRG